MSDASSAEVARKLINDVVDSFEKLEILTHVYRAGYVLLQASEIAKALGMPVDDVDQCVKEMTAARVFDRQGPWADAVAALVHMYEEDRIEVLNLMTKIALERVRQQAARVFADAFVLRPKKKGDPDG